MNDKVDQMIRILRPIFAVVVGLIIGSSLTALVGENPLNVLGIIFRSAFGSPYDLGMTLFYATPLIFTGLAVSTAFKTGLFNIGGEGQLTLGALAAAAIGILGPQRDMAPWPLGVLLAILAASAAGFLWGAIAGWLKAMRGSHEVVTTIMLNFVAANIASYATLYLLRNQETQNPETIDVGTNYLLGKWEYFGGAPISAALILAILCAVAMHIFWTKSRRGFEMSAVGIGEKAAEVAGIARRSSQIWGLALAGGIAGLAGLGDVLCSAGRFKLGFSADYGFTGIAVALLARSHPLGILGSAFLFGALHKGAADLDFETENVTHDLAVVLQACVVLIVCADGLWDWLSARRKNKNHQQLVKKEV